MLLPATMVVLCTTRIHSVGGANGDAVGTGYFYSISSEREGEHYPVLITNKHVIAGHREIRLQLQIYPASNKLRADGTADGEQRFLITVPLGDLVVMHPDPDVDLCAILVAPIISAVPRGMLLKHTFAGEDWRLTPAEAAYTRPVEPVVMVGYPNGLWDEANNRPIARQGLTASHLLHNWNGHRYFVIDAACFGGSSGSPVFLYEDGMYRSGEIDYRPGTRARLIGTLWGGPTLTARGELVPGIIPTNFGVIPQVSLMMNLGYVVKADAIDDLVPLVRARVVLQ